MNNTIGLESVLNRENGLNIFALGLDCKNISMNGKVLDILGACCLVSNEAHQLVLTAMEYYKVCFNESYMFENVVRMMRGDCVEYNVPKVLT